MTGAIVTSPFDVVKVSKFGELHGTHLTIASRRVCNPTYSKRHLNLPSNPCIRHISRTLSRTHRKRPQLSWPRRASKRAVLVRQAQVASSGTLLKPPR